MRSSLSLLRYAKSGHVTRRAPLKPQRPRARAPLLLVALTLGVGAASVGLARKDMGDKHRPTPETLGASKAPAALEAGSELSTEEIIERAERLHEQAQAEHNGGAVKGDSNKASKSDTHTGKTSSAPAGAPAAESVKLAAAPTTTRAVKVAVTDRVRRGETLSIALRRHGVSMEQVNLLVQGLKGVLDVRSIRPGDAYTIAEQVKVKAGDDKPTTPSSMGRFEFRPKSLAYGPTKIVADLVKGTEGGEKYLAEKQVTPIESKVVAVSGDVDSSLYVSMKAGGEGAALVNKFADVFAWNIDFYRETHKGDTWKVIVEKQYAEGRFIGYGKVLAAEYVNAGTVHRGFDFKSADGKVQGIFDETGDSLERTFLKSPMEVTRVTSRFGQRFHPVLKRWKAHNGIDYGAPTGTPFWAVADGTVIEAHYSKTAGNMVVLRHAQGYTTEYFHASRFAPGLKVGQKVKQRQVIAYVGNTGRSTGPHLHFGMRQHGNHVDPKKQKWPAANPVPSRYIPEYVKAIAALRAELEALEVS
jgi:murein DD-endopeptidase MepM/ murein hydrolase activator NlpD